MPSTNKQYQGSKRTVLLTDVNALLRLMQNHEPVSPFSTERKAHDSAGENHLR
jgi:hypothetical protein